MAKLNKQEVAAIAGKLRRELKKAAEKAREEAIRNYNPSKSYTVVKELIAKRDEINKKQASLREQRETIVSKANEILRESYGIWWEADRCEIENICDRMIDHECDIKRIPSIDELKEEVTIAAIDDSFDTAAFIENQIANFK